jgi:hypothetical protein
MNTQNPIVTPTAEDTREDMRDGTRDDDMRRDELRAETRADMRDDTSFLSDQASTKANERWKRVQAEFVDDPRKSVSEAHELVGELMQRIVESFSAERDQLEHQWSKGGDVSTEDLRVCLQRYRAFFSRLLPSVNGGAA